MTKNDERDRSRALFWYRLRRAFSRSSIPSWIVLAFSIVVTASLIIEPLQQPFKAIGVKYPETARYEIHGTVTSFNNEPVTAAEISVGGYRTTTDSSGAYTLHFAATSPDRVTVVFRRGGDTVVRTVNVAESDSKVLNATVNG